MPQEITSAPRVTETKHVLMLAAILLLGAGLRLYGLADRSIWYDEGCVLGHARFVNTSLDFMSSDFTSDAPLAPVLFRVWESVLALAPQLPPGSFAYDWMLRLVPCVLSLSALFLSYRLALLLTGGIQAALLSTLLMALSPFQVYYAQEIKPYSLYLVLSLLVFICALEALADGRARYWWALPFAMSAAFYAHFFAVWNIALLNVYFVFFLGKHWRHIWKWTAVNVAFVLLSLPGVLLAAQVSKYFEQIQTMWSIRPDLKTALITFQTFFSGYTGRTTVYHTLTLLAGICFLLGLWQFRRRTPTLVFVTLLTGGTVFGNIVVWNMRHFPIYEHRLFITSSVLVYIVVAQAIVKLRPPVLAAATAGAMAALMVPCLADCYAQRLHPVKTHLMGTRYKVENREAAALIRSQVLPGDLVAHVSHFTMIPFEYYLRDVSVGQKHICMNDGQIDGFLKSYPNRAVWNAYGVMPVKLVEATKSATRVWLVESWWEPFELPPMVLDQRAWMDSHFTRKNVTKFDGLTVYLYERNGVSAK